MCILPSESLDSSIPGDGKAIAICNGVKATVVDTKTEVSVFFWVQIQWSMPVPSLQVLRHLLAEIFKSLEVLLSFLGACTVWC